MKHKSIALGILSHVDAGKTTLSEDILYMTGAVRKKGQVDKGDSFFDSDTIERERHITIFSKQAEFTYNDSNITLLDTPGHVDFSAETERVLSVIDVAVLVISALDGVQSHTKTLYRLLRTYHVPTYVFVNKMDIVRVTKEELLRDLVDNIDSGCIDTGQEPINRVDILEELATLDEELLDEYIKTETVTKDSIAHAIARGNLIPVYFGSALEGTGITTLLDAITAYTIPRDYPDEFAARVFKVGRDKTNQRLTFIKILGGTLKLKDMVLAYHAYPEEAKKVNEIRRVSGDKYEALTEATSGQIVAVTGLDGSYPGQGLGCVQDAKLPSLIPILSYKVILQCDLSAHSIYDYMLILADEDPMLRPIWHESTGSVSVSLMGEVQLEVIRRKMKERFDVDIDFGAGDIVYKETIADTVIGHGHFEPLRHFADVTIRLEPLAEGSGIVVESICHSDVLSRGHQNQILSELLRGDITGVLTGSKLTDVKITLIDGKVHKKHTEGGDIKMATRIAIRDALLRAKSVLLEPYYHITLDVPSIYAGRAMKDISNMNGRIQEPLIIGERSVIEADVAVSESLNYAARVRSYTGGLGEIRFELAGYYPCNGSDTIISEIAYDYRSDINWPYESIYVHGGGESDLGESSVEDKPATNSKAALKKSKSPSIDEELEAIFRHTYGEIKRYRNDNSPHIYEADNEERIVRARKAYYESHPNESKKRENRSSVAPKKYLLVDGYNVIFSWRELQELARDNLEAARSRLVDILCNYEGYTGDELIVVFDAYKVKGGMGSDYYANNIRIVYTQENESADAYIERLTHDICKKEKASVSVVTSDGLVQTLVTGAGALRISAREFEDMVREVCVL